MPKKRPPPLIEPLPDYPILSGMTPAEAVVRRSVDYLERLKKMYDRYGLEVEPGVVSSPFVHAVLTEYVPGFSYAKRTGRPSRWKGDDGLKLIAGVWFLTRERGMTVWEACGFLVENDFEGIKQNALQTHFQRNPVRDEALRTFDRIDAELGREAFINAFCGLLPKSLRK